MLELFQAALCSLAMGFMHYGDQTVCYAGEELQQLDLSDNPMTEEVAPALAEALRGHSGLVRLNLNDTSLKDEGILAIAEVNGMSYA